jgi:translocation and assembly module TamB
VHEKAPVAAIGRRLLRAILVVVVGAVALVVVAILLLQVDAIATRVLPMAARFLPWEDATLGADRVSLSGLSRLQTRNLRITVPGEGPLLSIDSIDLSIRPLALLSGRIDIPSLHVSGVRAIATQEADSSWDLAAPFTTARDTTPRAEPMHVRIGSADIRDVRVTGRYAGTSDSLLIDDLIVRLEDLRTDGGVAVVLDTLHARVTAPGRTGPAVLSASARLSQGQLDVAGLRLRSDSSDVMARGSLVLPGPTVPEIREVDFRVTAEPLDFRDVAPLLPPSVRLPASMRLTATVTGQSTLLDVNVDGFTSDCSVIHVDGQLTPKTSGPVRYELNGFIRNLDPGLIGIAGTRGRAGAEFEISLSGDSLRSVNGTATIRLAGLEFDGVELRPSRLTARLENGIAHYQVESTLLPWAALSGSGTLNLVGEVPSYSLALRVSQLGVVPDSGLLQVTGVKAVVQVTGKGVSVAEREGHATLEIDSGQVGQAGLSGSARARWQRNRASADLSAQLAGASPVLDSLGAHVDWQGGTAEVRLAFLGLDLATASPSLPASSLNGTGRIHLVPGPVERMTARGVFEVERPLAGPTPIGPAHLEFELVRGLLSVEGNLQALQGDIRLIASARPFDPVPRFVLERLRFEGVALDSLTRGMVRAPVSGVLAARGTLPPGSPPQVTGRLDLDGGPFGRGRLDTLHAEFDLTGRRLVVDALARTGEGSLTLTGATELPPDGDFGNGRTTLEGRFDLPDLGALLAPKGDGSASGRIHLEGQGTQVESMRWQTSARVSGRWGEARLDSLQLEARIADARLTIDTLVLGSNVLHGGGGGQTSLVDSAPGPADTIRIQLVADTAAPATLSGLFGVDPLSIRMGVVEMRAWHAEAKVRVTGQVSLGGLIAGPGGADSLDIAAGAALSAAGISDVDGTATGLRVAWNRMTVERLEARLESDSNRFVFTAAVTRDNDHTLEVAAHGVMGERKLYFSGFGFGFGETRWALTDTASVTWDEPIVVSDFELRQGDRRISIEGRLDRQATQALSVRLDSVPLQRFAEFAGLVGVDAVLDGTVRIDGPAARPGVHTDLALSVPSMTARLLLQPAGEGEDVHLELTASEGRTLTVDGTVPNRLSLLRDPPSPDREREALSLAVRSDGFPLDWMTPFLQAFGVERFGGLLRADAKVEGTVASPRVSGTMGLTQGSLRLPRAGIDYHDMAGQLSLSGDRIVVQSWQARADGTANLDGHLVLRPLDNPSLDLRVHFDGFRSIQNEFVRLGLAGEATVTGTLDAPRLSGAVTIQKTDVFADQAGQNSSVRPVTLTDRDYEMLESYFGIRPDTSRLAGDLLTPWAIDLDVRIGGDVWLRRRVRPNANIVLGGSLEVRKEAGDSLQLFGTVEVVPNRSTVEQFGKKFDIEEGTITFNGPITGWDASFSARYEVPAYKDPGAAEVTITLDVEGGADDLRLTLGSDPAMETTDVVSYLATGRPASAAADFGATGGGLEGQSTAFAVGALTDVLEDEAGEKVGLDVMEITHDPAEGTLVIAGRYVSPKLYVGFQQPVTRGQREEGLDDQHQGTQVELEYSLYRWLLVNLQGGSEFRWFFRTRYAF